MTDLSTQPYKGVRDFYPEDDFIQRYIFDTWREVVEQFGYESYNASILEPAELYYAKSSDEIVSDQTYQLTDRSDREVVLRPEMTPTVARMVAGRSRELGYPLRLYSIPNLFRYERPQRGRLREHWQLNCDLFGDDTLSAEVEIILLTSRIMQSFGVTPDKFTIHVSSRSLLEIYFKKYNLDADEQTEALRLIDRWHKDASAREQLEKLLQSSFDLEPDAHINNLIQSLHDLGVTNVEFDRTIARGFDYYTGMIFEVFDNHPENNRSLFGGGRYDKLVQAFDVDPIPVVGFGMGDVTMRDVLETYDLLPTYQPATELCLIANSAGVVDETMAIAESLRKQGLRIATDTTLRKLSSAIKHADKRRCPFIAVIGEDEIKSNKLFLKQLSTGDTTETDLNNVVDTISRSLLED